MSPDESGALHRERDLATSFGSDTERYDRTRARCPRGLLDRVIAASRGRPVLDVGCGTGIVARQFRDTGCPVHAVEPDPRMADYALRHVASDALFDRWLGRQRSAADEKVFASVTDGTARSSRFHAPQRWQADWEQAYTRDEWLDRMPTQGPLNGLSASAQAEVLRRVGASIDAAGGRFTLRYTTVAIVARR